MPVNDILEVSDISTSAGDFQANGTALAGSTGRVADAGHVHPSSSSAVSFQLITQNLTFSEAVFPYTLNAPTGYAIVGLGLPVGNTGTYTTLYNGTDGSHGDGPAPASWTTTVTAITEATPSSDGTSWTITLATVLAPQWQSSAYSEWEYLPTTPPFSASADAPTATAYTIYATCVAV